MLLGSASLVSSGVMAREPKTPAKPTQVLKFDFKATVHADGSATDIEPDAALPEPIKAMIRKRVSTWRYKTPQWHGKAATATSIRQGIMAVPVTEAQGGYALRIEDVTGPEDLEWTRQRNDASVGSPKYPAALKKRGVSAVLIYAVLFDEAGKPQQVDLVRSFPGNRQVDSFDEAAREAIARWVWPRTFDGKPISCRAAVPIAFGTIPESAHTPSADDSTKVDAFAKYQDMCPLSLSLETKVKGTFL